MTATSGPGLDLKTETIGLAVMLELPMIIIDVQRAGPSTGMPTKTEQSDLLQALYGRHGESPLPVVAPSSPVAVLRRRLRGRAHRDHLPHAGDPAQRPLPRQLERAVEAARRRPTCRRSSRTSARAPADGTPFVPYRRDDNLARPWAIPGTPGLAAPHRRAREGRQDRRDLLRRRQPPAHDRPARGQGRRRRRPAAGGPRRRGRGPARASAGARASAPSAPACAARARAAPASPSRTSTTSTRCPPNTARCCAPTTACCCRR